MKQFGLASWRGKSLGDDFRAINERAVADFLREEILAEREACVQLAEAQMTTNCPDYEMSHRELYGNETAIAIAAAIRARETP